jgi:hypothetical protein
MTFALEVVEGDPADPVPPTAECDDACVGAILHEVEQAAGEG